MIGYNDFIIKVDYAYAKTFTTESGLELHADSRFSQDRLSNRIATVLETPLCLNECEIEKGFQVLIDPSIFYENTYEVKGTQETPFTIDKAKGLYKIDPSMIVCFRANQNDAWQGYNESLLVEPEVIEQDDLKSSLLIIEVNKKQVSDEYAHVVYTNTKLWSENVENGTRILKTKGFGVPFWIEGKERQWINNRHVLAIID